MGIYKIYALPKQAKLKFAHFGTVFLLTLFSFQSFAISIKFFKAPIFSKCENALVGVESYGNEEINQWYQQILQKSAEQPLTRPFVSIVIPAYREEARLPQSLAKLQAFLNRYPLPVEVLVVVEKSPDRTWQKAIDAVGNDLRFQIIDNQVQKGKGYAVKSGMLRARGNYAFFMDADLATPLPELLRFLATFIESPTTDILIGDRSQANGKRGTLRQLLSWGFTGLRQQILQLNTVTDTQCGFKAFKLEAAQQIFSRQTTNGFSFDVEDLLLADGLGYQIGQLPVQWYNNDEHSTVSSVRDPLKMLADLFRIRSIVQQTLSSPHH